MPDYGDDDDLNDDGDNGSGMRPEDHIAVRRANRAKAQAEAEREAIKRENAFLRAGIDPTDTRLGYFYKGYEGDLDPAKIKQAAVEAGFMQAAPVTPEQQAQIEADQAALGAQQRVVGAATGAEPDGADSLAARERALADAYANGGIEAMEAVMQSHGVPLATN